MLDALRWWQPPCFLKTVIVNIRGEETAVQGVLWRARGPWLVLRDASVLKPHGEPLKLDGEAVIHRSQVLFLQVLP